MKRIPTLLAVAAMLLALGLPRCSPAPPAELPLAMENDVISLDPQQEDDEVSFSVLRNIYECLVTFDGQMRIVPSLASSWENPNDLVWRFHLRPGVTFHDGRPMTARDAAFSLERCRRSNLGHYLSTVREVTVVDDLTIDVCTTRPSPVLLNKLTSVAIVPDGSPQPIEKPVGTGPYRFSSYVPGRTLSLAAYDNYWGPKPKIGRAVFKVISTPKLRAAALADGSILLARYVQKQDLDSLGLSRPVAFSAVPGFGVTVLGVNHRVKGPLSDRRVREALFWAVDPQAIIDETGIEARPISQLVSPYVVGYLSGPEPSRPQPERARELLRQAGITKPIPLELEISVSAANKGRAVARQAAAAGFAITVKPLEWPALYARLNRKQSPFYLVAWSCTSGDASDMLDACIHGSGRASYGNANWGSYQNPALDRLIEQSDQTLDTRARIELLNRIMDSLRVELPLVPLYVRSQTYGASDRLRFTPRQDGMVLVAEIEYRR